VLGTAASYHERNGGLAALSLRRSLYAGPDLPVIALSFATAVLALISLLAGRLVGDHGRWRKLPIVIGWLAMVAGAATFVAIIRDGLIYEPAKILVPLLALVCAWAGVRAARAFDALAGQRPAWMPAAWHRAASGDRTVSSRAQVVGCFSGITLALILIVLSVALR